MDTDSNSSKHTAWTEGIPTFVDTLYTEFFGVLLPGVVEIGFLTIIFIGMIWVASGSLVPCNGLLTKTTHAVAGIVFSDLMAVLCWSVFFGLSYLVGAVEYRRYPNIIDAFSIIRHAPRTLLWDNEIYSKEDVSEALKKGDFEASCKSREVVDVKMFWEKVSIPQSKRGSSDYKHFLLWACRIGGGFLLDVRWILPLSSLKQIRKRCRKVSYKNEYMYPYPLLRRYFQIRNLVELAELVPWCGGFESRCSSTFFGRTKKEWEDVNNHRTQSYCTKHQINLLRQQLESYQNIVDDKLLRRVRKNECHIKMCTSFFGVLRACQKWLFVSCLFSGFLATMIFIFVWLPKIFAKLNVDYVWYNSLHDSCTTYFAMFSLGFVGRILIDSPNALVMFVASACIMFYFLHILRRVLDAIHDLRKRELVDIFGAARIAVERMRAIGQRQGMTGNTVIERFVEEGRLYRENFCINCKRANECYLQPIQPFSQQYRLQIQKVGWWAGIENDLGE